MSNTNCGCCFTDYLVKCTDHITINTFLVEGTQLQWVITDKFDREWSGNVTVNADGYMTIPIADLPDGLLTEYSGQFRLQFYEVGASACAPITFLMAQEVNCIDFTVRAGTRIKSALGCPFSSL